MKDKEMIEEMIIDCCSVCLELYGDCNCKKDKCSSVKLESKRLIENGWVKLPEDSVVLSRAEFEEYKEFKSFMERNDWESIEEMETTLDKCQEVLYQRLQREYKKGYKKGKEKMKNRVFKKLFAINGKTRADIPHYRVVELAKQLGVEIKE